MKSWTLGVLYKAKVVEIGSNYTEDKCCLHGSCHLHEEVFKTLLSVGGGTSCWASNQE